MPGNICITTKKDFCNQLLALNRNNHKVFCDSFAKLRDQYKPIIGDSNYLLFLRDIINLLKSDFAKHPQQPEIIPDIEEILYYTIRSNKEKILRGTIIGDDRRYLEAMIGEYENETGDIVEPVVQPSTIFFKPEATISMGEVLKKIYPEATTEEIINMFKDLYADAKAEAKKAGPAVPGK